MKYLSKQRMETEKLQEARLDILIFIDDSSLELDHLISAVNLIEEVLKAQGVEV